MATTTTNLGLTKPATTDNVDVAVLNGNMDLIDAAVGKHRVYSNSVTAGGNRQIAMQRGVIFVFRGSSSLAAVGCVDQWSGVTMLHTNANISITCASGTVTISNSGSAAVNMLAIYTTA